jgi:hypothetical protein
VEDYNEFPSDGTFPDIYYYRIDTEDEWVKIMLDKSPNL